MCAVYKGTNLSTEQFRQRFRMRDHLSDIGFEKYEDGREFTLFNCTVVVCRIHDILYFTQKRDCIDKAGTHAKIKLTAAFCASRTVKF